MTIEITINNKEILTPPGKSVLEVANDNHITIPTLCYHKDLSTVGSCRLCIVEVEGWRGQVTACTLEAEQGMSIKTETPAVIQARREILKLLLQNYYDSDLESEPDQNEFAEWLKYYQVKPNHTSKLEMRYEVNSDPNPFIWVDLNKCILCTRCVRACAEIQGRYVWNVGYRGFETRIIAGADTDLISARCESCGACVAYCPTGALDNKMSRNLRFPEKVVTTTCTYCGVGCQVDLNIKGNKIIEVTSNPNSPVNGMHLCVKGRYGYDFVHHEERVTKPLIRKYLLEGTERPNGRGEWIETNWDTALTFTARKLASIQDEYGSDSIGILTSAKCLNEENYLMNKFARQVIGTNNIDHCARL